MRLSEIQTFLNELARLLQNGVPVRQALQSLADGPPTSKARLAGHLGSRVALGESLAEALKDAPEKLPAGYGAVIQAGEQSGKLPELLRKLAAETDQRIRLRKGVLTRIAYPVAITFLAILVVPAVLAESFWSYLLTESLFLVPVLVVVGGAAFLWKKSRDSPQLRFMIEGVLLRVPVFGGATLKASLGRSLSLMGLLLESGMSLTETFELTAETSGLKVLSDDFRGASDALSSGASFSDSMASIDALPSTQRREIANGEQSGSLDQVLQDGGRLLVEEAWTRMELLVKLVPIGAYFLAGVIVFVFAYKAFERYFSAVGL